MARSGPDQRSHLQWRSGQQTSGETSGSSETQSMPMLTHGLPTGHLLWDLADSASYLKLFLAGADIHISPPDHQPLPGVRLAGHGAICARLREDSE